MITKREKLVRFSPPSMLLFSGIAVVALSLDFNDEICINRPFYYAIVKVDQNQESGSQRVPLFSGIVTKPEI